MSAHSTWSATAAATSTITGQNSLSFNFKGSLAFTVFLSEVSNPEGGAISAIPQNSVLGRMVAVFDVEVSTPTRKVTGEGTVGWIVGGVYDPTTETISIAIRSCDVDASGTDATVGEAVQRSASAGVQFSTTLRWGWKAPRDYLGQIAWHLDPSTVLEAMKVPAAPLTSGREIDTYVVNSIPLTGARGQEYLVLDLKEPKPQTLTQTFQDETGLGNRTTTWTFVLMPHFSIERDGRTADASHSFVSTDSINLRTAIPGVTLSRSGWANLHSWEVKGTVPFGGSGIPSQMLGSTTFSFKPNPRERPTAGSTSRNRPLQYTVSATFNGRMEFFILNQDETDILRQEYIDHGEGFVPTRGDCLDHRIDNSFNEGNYNLVLDGGMQAALGKVVSEFGGKHGGVQVVGGFRSPQRNKAIGDVHPNNKHTLGRALDLTPQPLSPSSLLALYEACVRAGYDSSCEAAPGKVVSPGSPEGKHVHVDW